MNARLSRHHELWLCLGVETRIKAEDWDHLGGWARILDCPGKHWVVVHAQVVAEPKDYSVHCALG